MFKLQGLIAATYTPMDAEQNLNLDVIPAMVEHLIGDRVQGIYVCGSTGEGMSLTTAERKMTAEAYVTANQNRLPVIVQVGHNSLMEARDLARHAAQVGADAISATCPSYFKVTGIDSLIQSMKVVADGAPGLPFYYYHIPALTGSSIDIVEFMQRASQQIPNLAGLKYTDTKLHEFQSCVQLEQQKFDVVWGCDEMLLGALASGATAAIGSTYNVAAPLYHRLLQSFQTNQHGRSQQLQSLAIKMIQQIGQFPFHPAMKELLGILGLPMGPCRLPQMSLSETDRTQLRQGLEAIGYFDWGRKVDSEEAMKKPS